MPWWPSWASITTLVNIRQYQNTNFKLRMINWTLPWWFSRSYSNFHKWGVILRCLDDVSSFPLKRCFLAIRYLWLLWRKCLNSSNTCFPKLLEWRHFIFGPQTRHANFPFVWRPKRSYTIGLCKIIMHNLRIQK